jgi:uncharacterized membrane protein YeiH
VGGAVLRSVLIAREPHLMRPGTLEAVAALFGCTLYLLLTRTFDLAVTLSAWITIAVVFAIRALSVRYGIRTTALEGFHDTGTGAALKSE